MRGFKYISLLLVSLFLISCTQKPQLDKVNYNYFIENTRMATITIAKDDYDQHCYLYKGKGKVGPVSLNIEDKYIPLYKNDTRTYAGYDYYIDCISDYRIFFGNIDMKLLTVLIDDGTGDCYAFIQEGHTLPKKLIK